LAYIENILLKDIPTRDDLNKKIEREAKIVFDSASADDLTNFHSEAEIKHQIRNALYDVSMTDEMIKALIMTDDVLDGVYRLYLEEDMVGQVYLAVFDYLEKAEHDYLAERVFDRAILSYEAYIDEVKKMPPDKIIEEAYKIVALNEIKTGLDPYTSNINTDRLMALNALGDPLWNIYHEWMKCDVSHIDNITDTINETADKRIAENTDNSFENEHEDEDEYEI
jgi:hypothetical protein